MPNFSYAGVMSILMLIASNVFMTLAWCGHLSYKSKPLWIVIAASWGIAVFEYCFAVPANRIGSAVHSTAELKTMQEVITFAVFIILSIFWLGETITLQNVTGFTLIGLGAAVVIHA